MFFGANIILCLTISITVSNALNSADIRLVNGTGAYGGRVEVSINGIWGTICDDSFDMNDATVICRMMNLKASTFVTGTWFGEGIGPIYAQELKCSGYESHLKHCTFVSNVHCTHARDVGIICSECSEIVISNGNAADISADGTVLSAHCNTGFTSNTITSTCTEGQWSSPAIICKNDFRDIRLVNGVGLYDGRIELLANGTWGTVCSTSFSRPEARALCNILFGTTSYLTYFVTSSPYGAGTGPIFIENLECKGNENNINECSYSRNVSCTDHSRDAAVACNVQPFNINGTRLVNGTGPFDGRIELLVDDHWGTVCNIFVEFYDAQTICSTHNASLAAFFKTTVYGKGSGPVLTGVMDCYSARDHIKDCYVYSPYRQSCTHDYDLSLVCTSCGLPKIYNGEPVSFNNTELTVKCHAGSSPDYIKMRCMSSNAWVEDQRCTSYNDYPLEISEIRLVGNDLQSEGRAELLVNGTWGTICDTDFGIDEATVVCRMLGLQFSSFHTKASRFGIGSGTIWVDKLKCSGTESHISNCTYDISNYCTHYNDVGVTCTGYQLDIKNIRLAGTNAPYHGRVELEVNGTWGTVCQQYYLKNSAKVLCRMLGLTYKAFYYNAHFGPGTGPIYIHRPFCTGSESHINQCRYAIDSGYYNCGHDNDASIMCYGPHLNITDARLANGTGPFDGRAEIKVNDTWGTICDENFNILAADFFCSILGLRAAQFFTGAEYGEGSGPVFIDQLLCEEKDLELKNCNYLFLNECSHERDISVVCNECGQPDIFHWDAGYFTYNGTTLFADCSYYRTYIGTLRLACDNETKSWVTEGECQEYSYPLNVSGVRLADGLRPSNGRVEIKSLDTWGTVCDDNFGILEANVICNMIGYPPAVSYHAGAYYGEGIGPIFADDMSCGKDALDINDCTYRTYDDCTHENDISVVCTDCGDPTPENAFINSSTTSYQTAVHVTCEKDYALIGETDIVCQSNGSWSSKPVCKLIDCQDPTPEDGSRNSTDTINGTVVLIECDEGYNMSGETVITCQPDGNWSDYPSCIIIDCHDPEPVNAHFTLTGSKSTFGSTAIITCLDGHIPGDTGSATVSCLANGTWEKWSNCIPVDCGSTVPNKGIANTTETTYGTVVHITCPAGYKISGDSVIVCQANGKWTETPVCDTSDCGRLSLANGEANTTLGTTTGSIAIVKCNEGHTLNGLSIVMCTTSGWNDSTVECVIQACVDPTPKNGKVVNTDGFNGYVFRNYAEIQCNVGYELKGKSVITCEDGGLWSDLTSCKIKECGNLNAPADGVIENSKDQKYFAEIKFSCNVGFLLVGDVSTICDENGEWTSAVPTCVKKSDVGETCLNVAYCLYEDSRCINSICTCFTGIYDKTAKRCDTMPLLPYGISEGDTSMPKRHDFRAKVTFELGFPSFSSKHKDVYVSWYGFLSLDTVYGNPTPPRNQNSLTGISKNNILAPFYAPISIRKSRAVFFRSLDIRGSYEKMKANKESIGYIEMIVKKFGKRDSYDASFVLIATWESVKPSRGLDMSKTSTFQAVLTSDGKTTYFFYIYGHGKMKWVNELSSGPKVWVGYTVDTKIYTHAYSFADPVLQLDSVHSVSTTENDVAGLVFKPLSQPGKGHENHAVDCIRWYNDNYEDKKQLDFIASMTPECPCDIRLSKFDPWFWKISLQRWRTDITYACVNMLHVGVFGHYGKSCCYDLRSWLWVYERPHAGGLQLYNPRYPLQHILNDLTPKEKCCNLSDYCNLYYELRPTGSCYKSSPYDFGTFWGDPHFRTLDGMNFTFNGLGEYVLLEIRGDKTFDLHARTGRPLKEDGTLSEATIFTAFAAKDSTNASVHVEINSEKTGISLYGNKVDLTKQYYESKDSDDPFEWTAADYNLIISKRDQTLSVLFPSFGISLNISLSVEMLSLSTLVNKTLKGRTQGLLGNYNGDPYDDFTLPNGTALNANLTEREVFGYGKTWEIVANNSAFIYDQGKSHFDYHNSSYVPRFLDEADPKKVAEAEKVCNGFQNIQCVFDFVFIEKPEVALKTNAIKVESDSTRLELDESLPSLTGCDMIKAKKGENVTCNFTADGNDEVYFVSNSVNAKIDRESSMVVYTQTNEDPVNIRIASRNKNGRMSTIFVFDVLLCTACNKHGNCTAFPRDDDRENEYFRIAACLCESEYEGPDCENEFNGCTGSPCSLNRTCNRLSAKDQKLLGRPYNCSACPEGYIVDSEDATDCSDIDECSADTDTCQHTCTNTEGSFECSCRTGYKTDSKNKSKCRDINECTEGLHNCTHICNNTYGGFSCQCFVGYVFDTERGLCILAEDGTCNEHDKSACSDTSGCTLDNGQPVCFCSNGYELDDTGKHCKDIDECSRGLCPHNCVNKDGDFECVCYPGYKLEGRIACKECDILHWGENCTKDCVCTGRGASRCDNIRGCLCEDGWQGETCNEDIDECALPTQICDDSRKECVNNLGSYICECKTGFTETERGTCEDEDECSDPRLNKCSHICENTFGSYSCQCNAGYTKENETTCKDIDECELGTSQCEQICVNDPGQHSCLCNFGYTLSDDRQNCIKIFDLCLEINNLTCSHFCLIDSNSAKCSCRAGFRLASDNKTCSDIDECEEADGNQCDTNANCTNTDASFLCECPVGMKIENDGRTCTECDSSHFGKNCLSKCTCLFGTCDKKTGCVCDPGWGGMFCDTDIDECDTAQLICNDQNSVCVNLPGSAKCSCKTGFTTSSDSCTDIDECSNIGLNTCDQLCNNTEGSYFCSCRPGFIQKEKCTDINECVGSHGCDQECENTPGSYKCSCEEGFTLDLSDRKSCIPEHQCSPEENSTCPEHSTCNRKNGVVICTCMNGYQVSGTCNVCEDIDECKGETNPCSDNCSNKNGSFLCSCNIGQYLMNDKLTCRACESWKHGHNCVNDCACNKTNTNVCDPVDGQCGCKSGWSGELCDDDIDECTTGDVCLDNSNCSNSIGSFSCRCNAGYFKTGGGFCEECDSRHYGKHCLKECSCKPENTADCNHETGDCVCNNGWTGETCAEDVDECKLIPDVCLGKSNSTRENSQGSYTCECDSGSIEHAGRCEEICDATSDCTCKSGWTGKDCENDINECADEAVCPGHSMCENSEGSFECICDTGYIKTSTGKCQICDIWKFGKNCQFNCTCDTSKSLYCDPSHGVCTCESGWSGTNCEDDIDECIDDEICTEISSCINTHGSFDCNCHDGYHKTSTGKCEVGAIMIDLTVKLDYNLPNGTNLGASSTYEMLRKKCIESILNFVSQFVTVSVQVTVNDIRLGSLIVDYTIVYSSRDTAIASQLTKAVIELQNGSYFVFDGKNVSASSDSYRDLEPCVVFKKIFGSCGDGYSCKVENNVPACKLEDEESDVNWSIIIGVSTAGLFVATAIVFVLAWRFVEKGRKPRIQHEGHINDTISRDTIMKHLTPTKYKDGRQIQQ